MESLSLLVADDHQIVRAGVRSLLEREPGWQVVAEVADGREAVAKTLELRPDIVLLDIGMPVLNGLEAARKIVESGSRSKILILTVHDSEAMIRKILAVGVRGYVFKTDAATDLVNAVKHVQNGSTFFTPRVGELVLDGFMHYCGRPRAFPSPLAPLTLRQREVTQLLAEGRSTKEVAILLHVSVKTAETHRANVMRRLDCHSIAELIRYALCNQIIES